MQVHRLILQIIVSWRRLVESQAIIVIFEVLEFNLLFK